jgi:hypothetical protein
LEKERINELNKIMKKIAIITTKWNAAFVGNATEHCLARLHEL